MDIKNTVELVEAIKILEVSAKKISKDGVNLADLPEAIELIEHVDLFVSAIKDIKEIGPELKDLSQEELLELGSKVYSAFKEIKES